MVLARRFLIAKILFPLAIAILVCLPAIAEPAAEGSQPCAEASDIAVLNSPIAPWKGAPLRVVLASEKPLDGELSLIAPDGAVAVKTAERRGGPPYFWILEVTSPAAGSWKAILASDGACEAVTREIVVRDRQPAAPQAGNAGVWPLRATWNRATENLYSAWIEKLFDAPVEAAPSWPVLHEVLRDRSRNLLFNHLGLREDEKNIVMRPDCADLPYFLRAYFAFKMGLPFGFSKCSRGAGGEGPRCFEWTNSQMFEPARPPRPESASPLPILFRQPAPPRTVPQRLGLAASFGRYLSAVADGVHSGSARTSANDNNTDYYPVALSERTLRPGTIYADPYGHVLMLVKRVPQSGEGAGVFLAVDGQPDGTVARKRFWRGNFLFAQNPALGSPGFKHFRPIVREGGTLRRLSNEEISTSADYGDFSLDQARLGVEDFYDRMEDVMSPDPLDPSRALLEVIAALEEQVKARVTSVENGRKYQTTNRGVADMPDGPSIFETVGAWEDFATPSRDLRLLIAIDVARGFPDRVARRPDRYAMPKDKSAADVKADLETTLASELSTRTFSYTRSDGSAWTLALRDVLERSVALEMAYNVNDCVELRWGAPEGTDEASTCKRRAPAAQRTKMQDYRAWFHERRRPARA
ncbi:hypothetical protein JDN40_06300 [Rhodomicrobium vannielii ATCC 17100]|uniref:hypothetical protein n=1 Tax=Rhodomicrobium vannielii TaxID=1069 RepID=UPI00191B61DA|nr:hypothetical protein [Rhodomicrobium vannielii ATCC 17100]